MVLEDARMWNNRARREFLGHVLPKDNFHDLIESLKELYELTFNTPQPVAREDVLVPPSEQNERLPTPAPETAAAPEVPTSRESTNDLYAPDDFTPAIIEDTQPDPPTEEVPTTSVRFEEVAWSH